MAVVTPELGVPGLHSSAPLYHRLQQYRVPSGEIASLERKTRGERETDGLGGERVCVRETEETEEDPLPPLPHSSSPALPSLDPEPAEVYIIFQLLYVCCAIYYEWLCGVFYTTHRMVLRDTRTWWQWMCLKRVSRDSRLDRGRQGVSVGLEGEGGETVHPLLALTSWNCIH